MAPTLTYEDVKNKFTEKGAQLQMTEHEFEKLSQPSLYVYDIIASCGHTHKIRANNPFENTIMCLQCSKKQAIVKQIETHNSSEHNLGYQLEYDSYIFIKELISNAFDIIKLPEGTKADLLVKPNNIEDDLWCQIQLKATKAPARKNQYNFNLNKQYLNMVIICNCLEDEKLWVMSGDVFKDYRTVTLCEKNSKYEKYICKSDNLAKQLLQFYENENVKKIDSKSAYRDVCPNVAKEQKYRLLREAKLSFIAFEYSEMGGLVYDFKINGLKFQEKYNNHTNDNPNRFNFHLHKYGGTINNKAIECPYGQSDNDFYWFHVPGDKLFYVIPEIELLENGFIKSINQRGKKSIVLHPHCSFEDLTKRCITTAFANKYLFDYDNLDKSNNIYYEYFFIICFIICNGKSLQTLGTC
jgi:hypothetical protein